MDYILVHAFYVDLTLQNKSMPARREDARGKGTARWQALAKEKKDEINKKRREAYHKRKEQRLKIETTNGNLSEILVINNTWINIVISYL